MKFPLPDFRLITSGFSLKDTMVTLGVLLVGVVITFLSVLYTRRNIESAARIDFESTCTEFRIKIENRLDEHAQLLRSGEALFAVTDTVTRQQWNEFYIRTRIEYFLPGIQGFGYSKIIPRQDLNKHIQQVRREGFPDYEITPEGERDVYTSIVYLEPFSGRNLLAFGYDMYSEPVRRKAMEIARDSNMAMLSGRVTLVQETHEDVQAGVLMYIPVFAKNMPTGTVEERRAAIKGWVYSPYRMKDLMSGIQGNPPASNDIPVHLRIYDDDSISTGNLLYDSDADSISKAKKPNLNLVMPVVFNGKKWTLVFYGRKEELSPFHRGQIIVWVTGLIITILLFVLSMMQISANIRTRQIGILNKQLARLNADKDRFIAILSHDLKSPFTSILGFLELLITDIRRYSIEEIERHINTVNEAAKNTYSLLEDLLMWTRAHSGNIPFNPRKLSLREVSTSVIATMMSMADSKNVSLRFTEEREITVFADNEMLKAVLRNLVSNAIKFTNSGGNVTIRGEKHPGSVIVSVTDTGIGIEPEHLTRLFDITKIHSTAGTEGERGSGLGLILCREFIEKHGGKIWVESDYGRGSKFMFTLPD